LTGDRSSVHPEASGERWLLTGLPKKYLLKQLVLL